MSILHLNIEGEPLWYNMEVEPETYDFYSHLHESTIESPSSIIYTIDEFDGPYRLSRSIKNWEAETKEELALYDRVQLAKVQASRLLSE